MTNSTIQRTLAECRRLGWPAAVVEKWIAPARRRVDLFGLVDVLALAVPYPATVGIQACGASGDAAAHVRKALASPHLKAWIVCGNHFEIWAWRKVGARGKRKLWSRRTLKIKMIADDFWIREEGGLTSAEDWAIEEQQP